MSDLGLSSFTSDLTTSLPLPLLLANSVAKLSNRNFLEAAAAEDDIFDHFYEYCLSFLPLSTTSDPGLIIEWRVGHRRAPRRN